MSVLTLSGVGERRDLRELLDIEYGVGRVEADGRVTQGRLCVDAEGVVRWVSDVPEKGDDA